MKLFFCISGSPWRPKLDVDAPDAEPEPVNIEPVAESKAWLEVAYEAAQKEIESLKAQIAALKIHKFGLECFSSDNFIFKFYTGFLGYKHFYNFYHFVEPSAQHILMSCFYF